MRRLIFIVLLCCSTFMYGQQTSIENIRAFKLRNVGTLMEGNEGNGYYVFYEVEKKDRKTRVYSIKFLDANMNEIGKKTITGTRYLSLVDGEYNGENLLLKFVDFKEGEITYRQYSKTGELISKITEEAKSRELQVNPDGNSLVENSTGVLGIEGKGFISFLNRKFKKWGYEVKFIPNTKGNKGWTYTSDKDSKEIQTVSFLGANDKLALLSVTKRPGAMSKKMSFYMLGIDMNTGEKLFEKPMSDGKNSIMVTSSFFDEDTDEVTLMGYYYDSPDRVMSGKSKGIMVKKINQKGEYIFNQNLAWSGDLSKKLPVDAKGKLDDKGFLYFHEMTKSNDGNYYLVAEQYRKAVSGAGIAAGLAAAALGGTSSAGLAKIVIEDLYILEFSPEFELLGVSIAKKNSSNFQLPQGYEFVNISLLGAFVDMYGGFDFSFLQENKEEDAFSVVYYDFDRKTREGNIHTLTRIDGEYSDDKIERDADASYFRILPNKHGSIGILEYFRKGRTLNFRTEKFNY